MRTSPRRMTRRQKLLAALAVAVALVVAWYLTPDPNRVALEEIDRIGLQQDFEVTSEYSDTGWPCLGCSGLTTKVYASTRPLNETVSTVVKRLRSAGYSPRVKYNREEADDPLSGTPLVEIVDPPSYLVEVRVYRGNPLVLRASVNGERLSE